MAADCRRLITQSKSEEHQTAIDDTKLSIGLGKKSRLKRWRPYVNEVEDARRNAMWKMGLQSLVVYRCKVFSVEGTDCAGHIHVIQPDENPNAW